MSFNVWQNHGVVIPQVSNDEPEQPTVIYESGAQILAPNGDGKIFKMWFTTGPANTPIGINYAESNDGLTWTRYVSNPVIPSRWGSRIVKNGSTYYLYCSAAFTSTAIQVYTSSNGIAWTLQNATALTTGVSGWDSVYIGQLNVLTIDSNGKWWGYYWGLDTTVSANQHFKAGLATSTDGLNWTKDINNPVASLSSGTLANGTTWNITTSFTFATIGNVYYGWSQMVALSYPGANAQLPSDIMRWKATNPAGPWTALGVETYSRNAPASEGPSTPNGQVADPCIISALGNCYLFYTASSNGSSGTTYTVNAAIAPSTTLAQLVTTFEGVQNIPISSNPGLNLQVLASDDFNRPDGSLGANWTLLNFTNFVPAQIVSHKVTSTAAGGNCDSWYNAIAWPNDQWSQVTVNTCLASSFVGISLRQVSAGSSSTAYRIYWNGTTGSSGTWNIQRLQFGTFTTLASGSLTLNIGDTLLGAVVGSNILLYWNRLLIAVISDSALTSGNAGLLVIPVTTISNAAISAWSGGSFQNAPLIPGAGGNTTTSNVQQLTGAMYQLNQM